MFKIFIWGGISSDIRSDITFLWIRSRVTVNLISDRISDDIPPQYEKFEYSYPLIYSMTFGFTFSKKCQQH